jgi:hypothetical protein
MNERTSTGWYIGFDCHECSKYIPIIAASSGTRRVQTIVANPLKVMCPVCGTSELYEPADAVLFRVEQISP